MSQFFDFSDVSDDGVVTRRIRKIFGPRLRVAVPVSDLPSRTKQADTAGSDINNIVKRYKKTGELPLSKRAPMFTDMSAPDFKEALDLIRDAEYKFSELPSAVRTAFDNDPKKLLEALDRSNEPAVHQYLFDNGIFTEPPKAKDSPSVKAKPPAKGGKAAKEPELPMGDED